MSNMDNYLKQAIVNRNLSDIQRFIAYQKILLLKGWLDESLQSFCTTIRLSLQKSHRAKRQLVAEGDEIPYQMGVWEGWLQAFHAVYDEECKKNDILELIATKSLNTVKILHYLYQHDRPICHEKLANALGMSYNVLTNEMERAIMYGAVSASRTGRNTRYTLTPTAKRYCQEEIKKENPTK